MTSNPYEVLGLTPDATIDEVKNARASMAKKYHPDHNPGYADVANEKMAEINEAYEQIMRMFDEKNSAKDNAESQEETPSATSDNVQENVVPDEEVSGETEFNAGETAKASPKKLSTAIIAIVLVAGILIGLLMGGMGTAGTEPTTAPTTPTMQETEPVVIPSDGNPESALCKASYTVSDEDAIAARDMVVATMGDKKLTSAELQAYYWMEVSMFLQEYGSYADYIGLDIYAPLDTQMTEMGEKPMSWQQFFLDSAIYSWKTYQSMALEAEAAGYKMPADRQAELDTLPAELENTAKNTGVSVDELVARNISHGSTLDAYVNYVETYYKGMSYYYDYCEKIDPTDEEIKAYFEKNKDSYANIDMSEKYIDVRHVLLQPEGGEAGADGYPVFTDEAWEACRKQAEEIYSKWQEGDLSEESFAQLAKDHSVDGSASNGGLYENVIQGRMVSEFDAWCFDESRQVGDHGMVKTVYGYHIMFFSGSREVWYATAQNDLISELAYNRIPEVMEKYPATVDFSSIVLGEVSYS